MPPGFRPSAAVVALVTLSVSILVAQDRPTFRSSVDTVEVHVTVRGPGGELVTGLTKDDFELLDNGKRQEISVFSSDVQAIAVALLIDRSGSVSRDAEKIAEAAGAFVAELRPDDQASVNTLTMECQRLTRDKAALGAMLRSNIQMDMGSPVWAGVDRTITSLGGIGGRRAILLFSDGDDFGPNSIAMNPPPGLAMGPIAGPCHAWSDPSEASLADASRRAQREGIMVYTVSVEGSAGNANDGDLRSIARGSGGERYRLKDESELTAAFTRIVDELHHQYLLGFTPQALDGKVHPLAVRVKKSGLSVRARESYVAMPVNRAAPGAAAAVAPLPVLSDADVEQAVRAGSSGQKLQAACTASGVFPRRPPENDLFSEVVLEGPTGRIMRAAREARARKSTFTSADVTADLRAPVVLVTSQLKRAQGAVNPPADDPAYPPVITPTPTPSPSPTAPFVPAPVVAVRLRSKLLTEILLRPMPAAPVRGFTAPPLAAAGATRIDRFDLAAFRALPGPDVEVVVRSSAGPRQCSIGPKERAAVR